MSQNGGQIYLAFAELVNDYLGYLKTGNVDVKSAPFLKVQAFGPWSVTDKEEMQELCVIIAAITLLADTTQGN